MSQSAAPGGTVGGNGSSPWVNLHDYGIKNTAVYASRIAYDGGSLGGVYFRVMGDYIWARFKGSQAYTGDLSTRQLSLIAGTGFAPGVQNDVKFDVNIYSLTGDADLMSFLVPGNAVRFGPRLQLLSYGDLLSITPLNSQGIQTSAIHAGTMFGFGGFGMLNLSQLFGVSAQTSMGALLPQLNAAFTYGGRSSLMRYYSWEATIRLFKSGSLPNVASDGIVGSLAAPALAFEVGYAEYGFKQGLDDQLFPVVGLAPRDSNVNLRVTLPIIRGTLAF